MAENLEGNREQFLQIAREGAVKIAQEANPHTEGCPAGDGYVEGFTEGFAQAEVSGFFVSQDREEAARLEGFQQGWTECVETGKPVVGQLVGEGFDQGYDLGFANAKANFDLQPDDVDIYDGAYNDAVLDIAEWGLETGKLSPRKAQMIQDNFLIESAEPENAIGRVVSEEELLAALQSEFGHPTDEGSGP